MIVEWIGELLALLSRSSLTIDDVKGQLRGARVAPYPGAEDVPYLVTIEPAERITPAELRPLLGRWQQADAHIDREAEIVFYPRAESSATRVVVIAGVDSARDDSPIRWLMFRREVNT